MEKRSEPLRTCVVCRVVDRKNELIRFVVSDGRVVRDKEHKMDGRGAYAHPGCCSVPFMQFSKKVVGSLLRRKRGSGQSQITLKCEPDILLGE